MIIGPGIAITRQIHEVLVVMHNTVNIFGRHFVVG